MDLPSSPCLQQTLFAPLAGVVQRCGASRQCPSLRDADWLRLGVSRALPICPAGAPFSSRSAPFCRVARNAVISSRRSSAADWLAKVSPEKLTAALTENADEPHAELLARELTLRRTQMPFTRTLQLADAIRTILHEHKPRHNSEADDDCVRRIFQALRIAVNDEFGALDMFLRQLPSCLKPGGRVAILTFHSGEDRRVKHAFREGVRTGQYSITNEKIIQAGPEERRANPRSISAKLRWAVRSSDIPKAPSR